MEEGEDHLRERIVSMCVWRQICFFEIGMNGGDKESIKKMLLIEEVCVHLPVIRLYYPPCQSTYRE